jgi:hypothetical protein
MISIFFSLLFVAKAAHFMAELSVVFLTHTEGSTCSLDSHSDDTSTKLLDQIFFCKLAQMIDIIQPKPDILIGILGPGCKSKKPNSK